MKAVLCLSGGLDSTVLLYHLLTQGYEIRCLSVDYGQRHRRELTAAKSICLAAHVEHKVVDLHNVVELMGGSSQTSPDVPVPDGHYAEESMKVTVVPNRNMLLLALAGAWAVSTRSEFIAYAAHSGDHAIYPDCRPEFTDAVATALQLCDWHPVKLLRPFLYPTPLDKSEVVRLGAKVGVPFGTTWSCYKGEEFHCGTCGTCTERREAFQLAGITDPTTYLTQHVKEG